MAFDVETLLTELEAQLKTQLAAKITAINSEKGDTVLTAISNAAWISHSLDDKVKNFNDFVFYFIDDVRTQVAGPRSSEDYTIEIDLFIVRREDGNDQKRMLRYWRALKEAVAASWDAVGKGYDRATIETLVPIDIKLNDSSHHHKLVGVSLSFSIG